MNVNQGAASGGSATSREAFASVRRWVGAPMPSRYISRERQNSEPGRSSYRDLRHHGVIFGQLADDALVWSEEFHPKGIRTVKGRMKILKHEFGTMVASELTPRMIDAWLTEHVDWTPATKNRYRR